MKGDRLKVLMVEESQEFFHLVRKSISAAESSQVELEYCSDLSCALRLLETRTYDAVVLDLLPSHKGDFEIFSAIQAKAPDTPIVVLTAYDDIESALLALRKGAQDYLVKDRVNAQLLLRSLRFAVERQHMLITLRRLAMVDELTGLYNERGFQNLAEQHTRLAQRSRQTLAFFIVRLDSYRRISEEYGVAAGEQALTLIGEALRKSFRSSDVLARHSEDTFMVLAINAPAASLQSIRSRLDGHLADFNADNTLPYPLAVSSGFAHYEGGQELSLPAMIQQAEKTLPVRP